MSQVQKNLILKEKKHEVFTFHSPQPYSFISFVFILSKTLEDCYVAIEKCIKNRDKKFL